MEVIPVPEKCLTCTLDNFGSSLTIERSLYSEAFGDDTLHLMREVMWLRVLVS
jgi:hypothetical protein